MRLRSSSDASLLCRLRHAATVALGPRDYTPPHLTARLRDSAALIQGEIKQVSVLFCDVVDSTRLAHELGPEAMHALLSDFFERAVSEVHRFEGMVNQFLGDGFMALFGAPLAFEDHIERALHAALGVRAMVEQARALARVAGWGSVQLRMGVNSGEVVVGAIGADLRLDYTAVGDTTHLAARLQNAASAGEILCSGPTANNAGTRFAFGPERELELKGIASRQRAHALLGRHSTDAIASRLRSVMVGRERELAVLDAALVAARRGHGSVIEIEAEAGIGKTRLIEGFCARLPATSVVIRARCVSYGAQLPDTPLKELARALVEQDAVAATPDDGVADRGVLAAFFGDGESAMVERLDPISLRATTQRALVDSLCRVAARATLVLVLEDVHWADASSWAYFVELAGAAQDCACVVIASRRPASSPTWPAKVACQPIALLPLADAAGRELLALQPRAAELTPAAIDHVLARAEGNPFFIEELVRATLSTDARVPGDIVTVLAARIDRLARADKLYLRVAAVIGREFALTLLEEFTAAGEGGASSVAELQRQGFIEPTDVPGCYQFVHVLTRDAAYQAMLLSERRSLHRRVAHALAARASTDDSAEQIGRHFLASDRPALALPYVETALARAIRRHAIEAAYGFFGSAMTLYAAESPSAELDHRRARALIDASPVFHYLHKHEEYDALLERHSTAIEEHAEPALVGPYLARRGHRLWVVGRYAEAETVLMRAAELCQRCGEVASAASALTGW